MGAWMRAAVGVVLFMGAVEPVRAQYRNNGITFEAGPQSFEVVPWTLGAVASTEVAERLWGRHVGELVIPRKPKGWDLCRRRLYDPSALPCRNDWYGAGDGVFVGMGFQRVTGGLPLDVSETPLLENLVLTGRAGVAVAPGQWPRRPPTPVAVVQEDIGLRWNFMDEHWRPYVALNVGLATLVDPWRVFTRVRDNDDVCRRASDAQRSPTEEICVDRSNWVEQSPVTVNPSVGLWVMEVFPTMGALRPEAGVEYFFAEDISVQGHVTVMAHLTPHPQYLLKAPFVGASARGGASVVFYY